MLALVGLFSVVTSLMACQEPTVAGIRTEGEQYCEGFTDCLDGCDICGFTLCELPLDNAAEVCGCDFWMCYAFCAKQKCDSAWLGEAAGYCTQKILEGGETYARCQVNCNAAWTLSPLSALALMIVRW